MNYDKSQNETETLSADERKLRELCRSLKKTDAPHDFEFKLKARIANAKPADFKPRYGFALRYALPALAVILVLGLVAFNGALFSTGNNPPVAESSAPSSSLLPQNAVATTVATPETANQNLSVTPANQNPPKNSAVAAADRAPKIREVKNTSGSRILPLNGSGSALKSLNPNEIILPKGFDRKDVPQNLQNDEPTNPMPVKDVLSFIGVNAELENGKWKVRSVTANSVGESSDVKVNDVIESIDDQPLSAETVFTKTVKGNTLTITRAGAKLRINLRGKQ